MAVIRALPLLAVLAGCSQPAATDARPLVVVSVPPQAYFVERIAGNLVRVEVMIPPGANPVTHEPTIAQLRSVAGAALYAKVGHPNFPYERTWLEALLEDTPELHVVDTFAGVPRRLEDPHVWLSPPHARTMARNLEAALAALLPEHEGALEEKLGRFVAEIDALDAEIRALLAAKRGGRFLVFHPAWGYFAESYGLRQLAIERDQKEPDARQLAELIQRAREAGTQVVFAQPQFDPAGAELVAREIGGRVEVLDPLAYDWASNLRSVARRIGDGVTE